jgi:lipopolysaccharide export system permease protein
MKKLHIFIIKSFFQPFLTTLAIVLFILLMLFLFKYIDDLIGKSFPWYTILYLLYYANLSNISLALPLAILLSSIMTFGDLGEKYELVAIKASGISLQRAMYPLILLMGLLTGVAFYFSNVVGPYANLNMYSTLYDVSQLKPNFLIKPGIFNNDLGVTIRAEGKDRDGTLRDIIIYDHRRGQGNTTVYIAKTGTMLKSTDEKNLVITLNNGVQYDESAGPNGFDPRQRFTRLYFGQTEQKIPLQGYKLNNTEKSRWSNNSMMMDLKALHHNEDSVRKEIQAKRARTGNSIKGALIHYTGELKMDTLKPLKKPYLKSVDILASIPTYSQKSIILSSAIGSIQNMKSNFAAAVELEKADYLHLHQYEVDDQVKYSLSFACLIMFFIGAPLGAIIRKGGLGLPMVMSILFFLIWQILKNTGEKYGKEGVLPVYQGVWLASFILIPIGLFLTYKASTDSQIMDLDLYVQFFKKLRFWKKETQ